MCKRFLGAMLLALGIGLFGGWGSAQANSAPESTQSMLHVCWLKDAHVNPAACEVVRMPDAFEPAKSGDSCFISDASHGRTNEQRAEGITEIYKDSKNPCHELCSAAA